MQKWGGVIRAETSNMIIVQISDTHIAGWGKKTCDVAPTAENLAICIDHINQLEPPADVVLVTGDLTNEGSLEEAEHSAELLTKLRCPYFIVPGNHDSRKVLWPVFDEKVCPRNPLGFIHFSVDDYDVRLIGLDSLDQGKPGGKISKKSTRWLDEKLAEDKEKPTVIFMHHPPVKCGVLETDIDGFRGAKRLAEVIKKYDNIERILCGHIHMQTHIRWHGTVITTAPSSTGMRIETDLSMKKESQFILEAPSYLLHYWTPDKNLVTHTISIQQTEHYLFEKNSPS